MEVKKWKINKDGIIKSVFKVIKTKDIDNLTKDAYNFVMNLSGFIAHYGINGFKYEYKNTADFVKDLQNSYDIKDFNRYRRDKYFSECEQKEYYLTKADILEEISKLVNDINISETSKKIEYIETVLVY
jgi:hypothetical protein